MKYTVAFFSILLIAISCKDHPKEEKSVPQSQTSLKLELMAADKEFSSLSDEKGMKTAFIEYLDSNGVLLRSNQMPIVGANAIDYLVQQNDHDYKLTWDPRHAEVAQSGDLGYTYGVYALRPNEKDTVLYGTYVSIWKKQSDGSWKLMLDSGNEGVSEKSED